jgi:hypothetical protein
MTKSSDSRTDPAIVREVAGIYEGLDHELLLAATHAACLQCGRCCDFEAYGHRLFLTTPEWIYFRHGLGNRPIQPMPTGRCPYNQEGLCTVHAIRFSGCRIFGCRLEQQVQSDLTESTLHRLKALCVQYDLPYRYVDLASALNGRFADIGL